MNGQPFPSYQLPSLGNTQQGMSTLSFSCTEICQLLAICLILKGIIYILCCLYMSDSLFMYFYLIMAYYKSS